MKKMYGFSYPIISYLPPQLFRLNSIRRKKPDGQTVIKNPGKENDVDCDAVDGCVPNTAFTAFQHMKLIRQYTFTCEQDFVDISEGYCPSYAVDWMDKDNRSHWPDGTEIRHRPEYLVIKEKLDALSLQLDSECLEEVSVAGMNTSSSTDSSSKSVQFDVFHDIIPISNCNSCNNSL